MALIGSIVSVFVLIVICSASKHSHRAKISNRDADNSPTVTIDDGAIRGRVGQTVGEHKTYYAFQGIPFAQPPVGELRFEAPQPNSKWNETLDATADKPECHQFSPRNNSTNEASEDCLYINVYTTTLSQKKLPVMVWIYGGGFLGGNSSYKMYGPDYLIEKDVVYVSFNYRLNVFGFLSTGDSHAPGNNGLKDQVLALKWVQKNIAHFGGDPNSVTIFGQSAGSASVSYLQLSDLSKGLFHRTILQSGSALCTWALARQAKEDAHKLARKLNANVTSTRSLVASLKKVNASQLVKEASDYVVQSLLSDPLNGIAFTPVIEHQHDGAFFTGKAHDLVSKGQFHQVPSIIGINSNEAAGLVSNSPISVLNPVFLLQFDLNNSKLVPDDMNINNGLITSFVGSEIKRHYFGWLPIAVSASYKNLIRYLSDYYFLRPIRELVWQQSKYSKVYFYQFSYEGNLSYVTNRTYPGVGHAEDLFYIFRNPANASSKDALTRNRLIKLWTNFAKTSNPTPDTTDAVLQNVTWVQAGLINKELIYLDIGEDLELGLNPQNQNVKFWNDLYRRNGHPPYDTY